MDNKQSWFLGTLAAVVLVALLFGSRFFVSVPAGSVGVSTLFGEVTSEAYTEGLHFPVNPLLSWTFFSTREKTLKETSQVPSQDQLMTTVVVNVQFGIEGSMAPRMYQEVGTFDEIVNVYLVPKLRSLIREQGKTIQRAEDFFQEATQERLQKSILSELQDYLAPKGVKVYAVLISDISLPEFITKAIESKKEREQEVLKQKAELERFQTEQQQKIASASAEKEAAMMQAETRRVLADAQAYEIEKINEAVRGDSAYVQLQSLKALEKISENPASQMYFLSADSPSPVPLMHIGDTHAVAK